MTPASKWPPDIAGAVQVVPLWRARGGLDDGICTVLRTYKNAICRAGTGASRSCRVACRRVRRRWTLRPCRPTAARTRSSSRGCSARAAWAPTLPPPSPRPPAASPFSRSVTHPVSAAADLCLKVFPTGMHSELIPAMQVCTQLSLSRQLMGERQGWQSGYDWASLGRWRAPIQICFKPGCTAGCKGKGRRQPHLAACPGRRSHESNCCRR